MAIHYETHLTPSGKAQKEFEDFLDSWAHRNQIVLKGSKPLRFDIYGHQTAFVGQVEFDGSPFDLTLEDWERLSSCTQAGHVSDRILTFIMTQKNQPFTAADIGGVHSLKVLTGTLQDFRAPYEVEAVGTRKGLNTYRLKRVYRPA